MLSQPQAKSVFYLINTIKPIGFYIVLPNFYKMSSDSFIHFPNSFPYQWQWYASPMHGNPCTWALISILSKFQIPCSINLAISFIISICHIGFLSLTNAFDKVYSIFFLVQYSLFYIKKDFFSNHIPLIW